MPHDYRTDPAMRTAALIALLLATSAGLARAEDDLAGHYYLGGVREVGSELRLMPDGRFQWYLSYGAMDQQAEGAWTREGEQVVLQADPPGEDEGWARLKDSRDWDGAAEYSWRRQVHQTALAGIEARCPFLHAAPASATSAAEAMADVPDEQALRHAIATQEGRLATFVRQAEDAAAAAMAANAATRPAAMERATRAMADYWREQYALKDLYWQLPGAKPAYAVLALPAACTAPAEPVRDTDPADWQPRAAVFVHDDEQDAYFNGIPVTLVYADGREETVATRAGGYAFATRADARPTAILLGDPRGMDAGTAMLRLEIPKGARAVLQVDLQTQALTGPVFERMQLRVDAGQLIPTWPDGREQGRYSRD
jgi:hypothetical protein